MQGSVHTMARVEDMSLLYYSDVIGVSRLLCSLHCSLNMARTKISMSNSCSYMIVAEINVGSLRSLSLRSFRFQSFSTEIYRLSIFSQLHHYGVFPYISHYQTLQALLTSSPFCHLMRSLPSRQPSADANVMITSTPILDSL